jgi:hypothetical protein
MQVDWLIRNTDIGRGFIASRVQIVTYTAIYQVYGGAYVFSAGRTVNGIDIGKILKPSDIVEGE